MSEFSDAFNELARSQAHHCSNCDALAKEVKGLNQDLDWKAKAYNTMMKEYRILQQQNERFRNGLERIANDKEFSHSLGHFIRPVWYVEEAKRILQGGAK